MLKLNNELINADIAKNKNWDLKKPQPFGNTKADYVLDFTFTGEDGVVHKLTKAGGNVFSHTVAGQPFLVQQYKSANQELSLSIRFVWGENDIVTCPEFLFENKADYILTDDDDFDIEEEELQQKKAKHPQFKKDSTKDDQKEPTQDKSQEHENEKEQKEEQEQEQQEEEQEEELHSENEEEQEDQKNTKKTTRILEQNASDEQEELEELDQETEDDSQNNKYQKQKHKKQKSNKRESDSKEEPYFPLKEQDCKFFAHERLMRYARRLEKEFDRIYEGRKVGPQQCLLFFDSEQDTPSLRSLDEKPMQTLIVLGKQHPFSIPIKTTSKNERIFNVTNFKPMMKCFKLCKTLFTEPIQLNTMIVFKVSNCKMGCFNTDKSPLLQLGGEQAKNQYSIFLNLNAFPIPFSFQTNMEQEIGPISCAPGKAMIFSSNVALKMLAGPKQKGLFVFMTSAYVPEAPAVKRSGKPKASAVRLCFFCFFICFVRKLHVSLIRNPMSKKQRMMCLYGKKRWRRTSWILKWKFMVDWTRCVQC